MVPAALWFLNGNATHCRIAFLIFMAASITDFLDGYLARKYKLGSKLGKLLDPLADKLLINSVLIWLVALGRVPAWLVVMLVGRETAITGLRGIAASQNLVLPAGEIGKDKTMAQMIGVMSVMLYFPYKMYFFDEPLDYGKMGVYMLYFALALSIISALSYAKHLYHAMDW